MANLNTASDGERSVALRARIALANLGNVNGPIGCEVATGHQTDHVLPSLIGPGDPCAAIDDAWIDEVPDTR